MTYEANSGGCADQQGWVDLTPWTGRGLNNLCPSIREPDEALTHCESILAATGDPACDPRSGGIAGAAHLAARCGMTVVPFRRDWLRRMTFVRWLADIPVSNVGSVDAWAEGCRAEVRRGRVERLGLGEE
jgi:hypothetical protein